MGIDKRVFTLDVNIAFFAAIGFSSAEIGTPQSKTKVIVKIESKERSAVRVLRFIFSPLSTIQTSLFDEEVSFSNTSLYFVERK